jgi:hypothetical protein
MSHYCEIETQFNDQQALIEALVSVKGGWNLEQIEIHQTPQSLVGYQGDQREQKANIIIRRQHVRGASNDVGFALQPDGSYKAIISDYDRNNHCNDRFMSALKTEYGCLAVEKQAQQRGKVVTRVPQKDGRVLLQVRGYR